tara:strand:+ start:921 stop:1073 length:153 start_codon:yes stop_codon:yes gene_type:complete
VIVKNPKKRKKIMVKFMMAGIIAFSMSSTEVNWKEITLIFRTGHITLKKR